MNELSFEARLARLDEILEAVQSGQTALQDTVTLFEEGMELLASLKAELGQVQEKVKVLTSSAMGVKLEDFAEGDGL